MNRTIADELLNSHRTSSSMIKNLNGMQARLEKSSYCACPTDADYFPPLLTEGVDYCCLEYGLSSRDHVTSILSEVAGINPKSASSMLTKFNKLM